MDEGNGNENGLWVFGYGSLCWHPGFTYKRSMTGFVKGFGRRFWQGNTTHRGTVDKGTAYGRAFQVDDVTALPYLQKRECTLGGYLTTISTFHSRDGTRTFPVIIYVATNENEHWLGEAPLHSIARQITECSGPSGHNVEYLLRLADFMHRYIPEAHDEHLFTLELLVRARIKELNMCLVSLMGNKDFSINLRDIEEDNQEERDNEDNVVGNHLRENSFQYTSRVPVKTLRCLNM